MKFKVKKPFQTAISRRILEIGFFCFLGITCKHFITQSVLDTSGLIETWELHGHFIGYWVAVV
jgi:hypothetical protein